MWRPSSAALFLRTFSDKDVGTARARSRCRDAAGRAVSEENRCIASRLTDANTRRPESFTATD